MGLGISVHESVSPLQTGGMDAAGLERLNKLARNHPVLSVVLADSEKIITHHLLDFVDYELNNGQQQVRIIGLIIGLSRIPHLGL